MEKFFSHSTETIIWTRKQLNIKKKGNHFFNYQLMKEENGGKQMKDVWYFEEPEIWKIPTASKKEKKNGIIQPKNLNAYLKE